MTPREMAEQAAGLSREDARAAGFRWHAWHSPVFPLQVAATELCGGRVLYKVAGGGNHYEFLEHDEVEVEP
jgi:hypothetical protein